jgi:hypothetical protein
MEKDSSGYARGPRTKKAIDRQVSKKAAAPACANE